MKANSGDVRGRLAESNKRGSHPMSITTWGMREADLCISPSDPTRGASAQVLPCPTLRDAGTKVLFEHKVSRPRPRTREHTPVPSQAMHPLHISGHELRCASAQHKAKWDAVSRGGAAMRAAGPSERKFQAMGRSSNRSRRPLARLQRGSDGQGHRQLRDLCVNLSRR